MFTNLCVGAFLSQKWCQFILHILWTFRITWGFNIPQVFNWQLVRLINFSEIKMYTFYPYPYLDDITWSCQVCFFFMLLPDLIFSNFNKWTHTCTMNLCLKLWAMVLLLFIRLFKNYKLDCRNWFCLEKAKRMSVVALKRPPTPPSFAGHPPSTRLPRAAPPTAASWCGSSIRRRRPSTARPTAATSLARLLGPFLTMEIATFRLSWKNHFRKDSPRVAKKIIPMLTETSKEESSRKRNAFEERFLP